MQCDSAVYAHQGVPQHSSTYVSTDRSVQVVGKRASRALPPRMPRLTERVYKGTGRHSCRDAKVSSCKPLFARVIPSPRSTVNHLPGTREGNTHMHGEVLTWPYSSLARSGTGGAGGGCAGRGRPRRRLRRRTCSVWRTWRAMGRAAGKRRA
jgi:hypothetical protein